MDVNNTTKVNSTIVNSINPNDDFSNLIFNPIVILTVFFVIVLYFSFSLGNNGSTEGFVFGDTGSDSNSNNSVTSFH